jgi:serine/threonine protein kinase
VPAKLFAHLNTVIEVAKAVTELHRLQIWHVDLNPMNILCRWEGGTPVVRIVDFESSYEVTRHASAFYNPPTTTGYSAPELGRQAPDARADLFSLGAVCYTMLAGPQWTWADDIAHSVGADREIDAELKDILLTAVDPDPGRRFASVDALRCALAGYRT